MPVELLVREIQLVMDSSMQRPCPCIKCLGHLTEHSFWSYELCKRLMTSEDDGTHQAALKVLLCGGIAGVITWGSVFPLDMVKTRLQAQTIHHSPVGTAPEGQSLLQSQHRTMSTMQITRETYRTEGVAAFYRGLGVCSIRAFIVNAVQVGLSLLLATFGTDHYSI